MSNSVHPEPVEDPYVFKPIAWILDTPGYITPREYVRLASAPTFMRKWVENRLEKYPTSARVNPSWYIPSMLKIKQPAQLLMALAKDMQSGDFYVRSNSKVFDSMPFSLNYRTLAKDRKLRQDMWLEKDLEVVRYLQEQVLYGYILGFIFRMTAFEAERLEHDTGDLS